MERNNKARINSALRKERKINTMKYFNNIESLQELKKLYHRLAKEYHPDASAKGSNEIMAEINAEYKLMFEKLKEFNNASANANVEGFKATDEEASDFIEILNDLIKYEGLKIEICGLWLWVSGDTKPIKETLKAHGLRYSKNKGAWYLNTTGYVKWFKGRKAWSMNEIRSAYGSKVFEKGTLAKELETA